MPVGPWYEVGSTRISDADAVSYDVPVTGVGRVCGVSVSSAPNVMTFVTPRRSTWPSSSRQNAFQRRFGSIPLTSTTCRSVPGSCATDSRVVCQSMRRVTPPVRRTCGRVTWKS